MGATRGAVAAGHPLTAETGAQVLRDGGNAVDAAAAAVMTSFVTESPLTGLGAGGYMLVHEGAETEVLDFFVAVRGAGDRPRARRRGRQRGAGLLPPDPGPDPHALRGGAGPVRAGGLHPQGGRALSLPGPRR